MNYDNQHKLDIGPILDECAWARYGMVVTLLASLAYLVDGMALQVVSLSIPAMMRDWHVQRGAFSNVIALGYLGVSIGTIGVGFLADRLGRRTMLLASILVFGLATAAISQVGDIPSLLVLRFIDGLGLGGAIPTATSLMAEFAPAQRRTRAINLGTISISVGGMSAGLIGAKILSDYNWHILFLTIAGVTLAVLLLLLAFLPESPRFLVRDASRHTQLRRTLARLKIDVAPDTQLIDTRRSKGRTPLGALFGSGALANTLGLWAAFFFCLMTTYSLVSWIPTVFASRGYSLDTTSTTLSFYGFGGICGSLLCARLVEILGSRKTMSILAAFGVLMAITLSLLPLNPQDSHLPMVAAIIGLGLCIGGLTSCLYSLAAYTYVPAVKATGIGAASGVGRIGGIVSPYLAAAAMAFGGSHAFFQYVAVSTLILLLLILAVGTHIPREQEITK
jgi:AAHS family 4-hydroxybenzoate transporter-like MFS transporter